MRHNYAGDQGDYAKYALLNQLAGDGQLVVGINWYLTEHHENNADGGVRPHLEKPGEWEHLDTPLLTRMVDVFREVAADDRRVQLLHDLQMLHGVKTQPVAPVFFDDPLPTGGMATAARIAAREAWHRAAMAKLQDAEIVFLDPDNGLEVKSRGPRSKWRCKYATYAEVNDYLAAGKSVVPYQHARRMKWPVLVAKVSAEMREAGVQMASPGFVAFGDRGFFLLSRDPAQVAEMTRGALALQTRVAARVREAREAGLACATLRITVIPGAG